MRTLGAVLVACFSLTALGTHAAAPALESINPNDNRDAAGSLRDGLLTVNLEARRGTWFPDGPSNPSIDVHAFGEAGGPLQVPGPLLRVTEGTEIRVLFRNALAAPLVLHGLYTRDQTGRAARDTVHVAAGSTREIRFLAGQPGTYFYWGATTDVPNWGAEHPVIDSQLSGAFIIDPRGTSGPPRDRVLLLGVWANGDLTDAGDVGTVVTRFVINGRTWPHTERLSYVLSESIHFRLINVSSEVHPMHLHGFYFRVRSRGSEDVDSTYATSAAPYLAVTERLAPGRTATISWTPDRPGNWLFHCHDNAHIQPSLPFDGTPPARPEHVQNHTTQLMGGLVLAVEVKGSALAKSSEPESRRLRLIARRGASATATEPLYGFVLQGDARVSQPGQPSLAGPNIVLTRDQPVAITVVNELAEATSVHWHGIELESYFDGVADFAGTPGRLAPAIAPRDSFEARFTPPRAGTFIYHTHVDELRQQRAGLAGALLVLEPGETYDPTTDLVFLISTPVLHADRGIVMLNGTTKPQPLDLQFGTRYRFRVINIHTYRPSIRVELRQDSTVLSWRPLAKDGATLPAERSTERRAALQIGNGETYDYEFVPRTRGALQLAIMRGTGFPMLTQPINVR